MEWSMEWKLRRWTTPWSATHWRTSAESSWTKSNRPGLRSWRLRWLLFVDQNDEYAIEIFFMVFSKYHLLIRTFSDAFFGNSQRNIRRTLQKTCLHRTTFLNSAESGFLCVCKMKGTTHEIELNQKSAHSLVCATKLQTSVRVKTIIRSVPTDSIWCHSQHSFYESV